MIPDTELEILRLKFRVELLTVLVGMLCNTLAGTSPEIAKALRDKFAMLRSERDKNLPSGASSEMEILISTEFRAALGDILEKIDQAIPG